MNIALLYCGLPRWNRALLQAQASMLQRPAGSRLEVFVALWREEGFDYRQVDRDVTEVFGVAPAALHVIDGYEPVIPAGATHPPEVRPVNVYKMHRAIEYVNEVRERHAQAQGRPHDLVIRSRTDLLIDRPLDLARLGGVAQHAIVLPFNGHWRGGYCDQFALASERDFAHYAGLHRALDDHLGSGQLLHPERLLRHHLVQRGCPVVFGDFEVSLHR